MDLSAINYIVTIAEEKKLSTASKKLFVTSSALSQCIKKLEYELGIPIFEKINPHTFQLTAGGKIYVEAAKKILQIKEETYRKLNDVQHATRGSFNFGCSPNRGLGMLSSVFPVFHKTYPNIQINLMETNLNMIFDYIIDGSVDIGVLTPLSEEHKFINLELLDQEEIVLGVPLDHELAKQAKKNGEGSIAITDLKQLEDDDWMMTNKESMLRDMTNSIYEQAGFFPSNILLETSSTSPHINAIREGIALSFIPMPRKAELKHMRVFHLKPRQYRKLYAAYRKSYILSESQRFFIDQIREFYTTARKNELPKPSPEW